MGGQCTRIDCRTTPKYSEYRSAGLRRPAKPGTSVVPRVISMCGPTAVCDCVAGWMGCIGKRCRARRTCRRCCRTSSRSCASTWYNRQHPMLRNRQHPMQRNRQHPMQRNRQRNMLRSHTGCNVPCHLARQGCASDWVRSTGTPSSTESRGATTAQRSSVKLKVTEWSERVLYVVWHLAWHVAGCT